MTTNNGDAKKITRQVITKGAVTETLTITGDHELAQQIWEAGWELVKEAAKLGFGPKIGEDE